MKKRLLFVYDGMVIGGSTTSLLSILNSIDYKRYEVDLLLYINEGALFNQIPKQVNILPHASIYPPSAKGVKILRSILAGDILRALYYGLLIDKKLIINWQAMVYATVTNSRRLDVEYDAAIGFLEGWPNAYVALKAKAQNKIGWVHLDWKGSHLNPKIFDRVYAKFDTIVLVSQKCMDNYIEMFPKFKSKAVYIENILSQKTIRNMAHKFIADLAIDKAKINLVSVCRIEFHHKGLDRGIKAFTKLKKENLIENFHWYIIGDGSDIDNLKNMITENFLGQFITVLGPQNNPLPYVALMDVFFLPSRYEGKPMAVTEAQMLGVPALVTAYASANEQIENGIDGVVLENTDDAVYTGLKNLVNGKNKINIMKQNAYNRDYSTKEVIEAIYDIVG
jgi:glycosyltransferase involved in cell wall biosynthesis